MKEVLFGTVAVILVVAILFYFTSSTKTPKHLTLSEAKKALENGTIRSIVDVRTASEYQVGHYPGAISFPSNIINEQTVTRKEISEHIYSPTLVYCETGRRAKKAATLLSKYGIDTVYYVSVPYHKLIISK
jgi:phage shock protein E